MTMTMLMAVMRMRARRSRATVVARDRVIAVLVVVSTWRSQSGGKERCGRWRSVWRWQGYLDVGTGRRVGHAERPPVLGRFAAMRTGPTLVLLVLALFAAPSRASGAALCTDTWTGPAQGNWATASDWSTGAMPTSSDVVCVSAGKTVDVTAGTNQAGVLDDEGGLVISGGSLELVGSLTEEASNVSALALTGGVLDVAGAVDVARAFMAANDVKISGGGTLTIQSAATGTISASSDDCSDLALSGSGTTLVNDGVLQFSEFAGGYNGGIYFEGGAELTNNGTFDDNAENLLGDGCGGGASLKGSGVFTSTGVFAKTAGGGTSTVGVPFNNSGSVSANTGTLAFDAGGVSSSGSWSASSGAEVAFTGGSYTLSGDTQATNGNLAVSSGSLTIAAGSVIPVSALALTGGVLDVAGAVDVARAFTAANDVKISGGGTLTIQSAATGTISASSDDCSDLALSGSGTTLVNDGVLQFSEFAGGYNGGIYFEGGAELTNNGTFDDNAENLLGDGCGGGASLKGSGVFTSTGVFAKTAGGGTSTVGVPFNNSGSVSANTGTLAFDAGGASSSGSWSASSGAEVAFTGGAYALSGDTQATNGDLAVSRGSLTIAAGSVVPVSALALTGGVLDVAGAVDVARAFTAAKDVKISGGGTLTIQSAATGTISASSDDCSDLVLSGSGTTLVNDGVLQFSEFASGNNGGIYFEGGAELTNDGTFDDNAENVSGDGCGGDASLEGSGVFTSMGVFAKTAGGGTSTVGVPFNNSGTVNVQSGTLKVTGNYANNKLISVGAGDTLSVTGNYTQTENGTLKVAIASASSYGRLSVGGTSTVGGLLSVAPVDGFVGELGQTFSILSSSARAGVFAYEAGGAISSSLAYQPLYSATGVTLAVASSEGGEPVPTLKSPPTISGTPQQGQTLILTHGSWEHAQGGYVDQWLRCEAGGACEPVPGADGQSYLVGSSDVGRTLAVREVAEDASGQSSPATSAQTAVVSALPLRAIAGESVSAVEGQPMTFDGSASTPASEISSYEWEFGDGESAQGLEVRHTYREAGSYEATLTVTRGSERESQRVTVTVSPKPKAANVAAITVRESSGSPVSNVEVLFIAGDGERTEAFTNSEGVADLDGLPEGTDAVYAYESGFRPATGMVTVNGEHAGSASVTLQPGEVVSTGLSSHELTLSEIVKDGINPSEPANQTVYSVEAEVELVGSLTLELHGDVNSSGGFAGGGSGLSAGGGSYASCSRVPHGCETTVEEPSSGTSVSVVATPVIIEDHPVIEWLIFRTDTAMVKQFVEVSMVVQNLSTEQPFALGAGTATLNLPSGMSLAPTSKLQSPAQSVGSIPPLGSATASWIVRGDTSGEYTLSAGYEGALEPFGQPVRMQSALASPLHVWGANALSPILRVQAGPVEQGIPYHVALGVKNVSDIPLYNVAITGSGKAEHFIFQPEQQFDSTIGELKPGETVSAPEDIVVSPSVLEIVEPHGGVVIGETAAELEHVSLAGEGVTSGSVERVPAPALYEAKASPAAGSGQVDVQWQRVPGAEGYEVFATPSLGTPFGSAPIATLPASASSTNVTGSSSEFYAVSTLIGGRLVLDHPLVEAAQAERERHEKEEEREREKKEEGELEEVKHKGEEEATKNRELGEHNEAEPDRLRCLNGDAVNCATGNHTETQTDLVVGGRGPALELTRAYNSQQAAGQGTPGRFGYGWSGPGDASITLSRWCTFTEDVCREGIGGGGFATVRQANASTVFFSWQERDGKDAWVPGPLVEATLREEGGDLVYRLPDGHALAFDMAGHVSSHLGPAGFFTWTEGTAPISGEVDRNGNALSFSYGQAGQLTSITDSAGREITLGYDSEGQVTSAVDPMGHTVKYSYEHGDLVSVTEPGETTPRWKFAYNSANEMTSEIEGGNPATTTQYDSAHRVVAQTDAMGRKWTWTYTPLQSGSQTAIGEPNGSMTVECFNTDGAPTSVTRGYGTPLAATSTSEYNGEGELVSSTDPDGDSTTYTYDAEDNRTSETDPLGNASKWSYNSDHEITSETKPNGEMATITRDEHGNPIEVVRPAPGDQTETTKYGYDSQGDLVAITNPLGHTWTYAYDSDGDRTSETDPEGDERTFSYDKDSNVIASVSPRGNSKGANPREFTTTFERDAQERVIDVTTPGGATTKTSYNADGEVASATEPDGHTTNYSYDADNELVKVSEPDGAGKETEYDPAGQVIAQIDPDHHKTSYVRNALEEVTEVIDPVAHKTTKTYTPDGELASETNPEGQTTSYSYDADNRLRKVSYSDGKTPTVEYEYDKDGNRTKMRDGTGTTSYAYDQLNRLTESVNGHGERTAYEYNLAGEQTEIIYPNGHAVTRTFDADARLSSVKDWSGDTTSFSYDPDSDLTATVFPEGTGEQDTYTYNNADQLTQAVMQEGKKKLATLKYKRAKNGQLTKTTTTGLPGEKTSAYTYDTSGRLTQAGSTSYEYDLAGNPTKIGAITNTFNAADQLMSSSSGSTYAYNEQGERINTTPSSGPTTTYTYDQAGNLTAVNRPEAGSTPRIEDIYTHNGENLRATQTISGNTRYLTWDTTANPPILLSDGTNAYIYGPEGLAVEQVSSGGTVTYLHHDQQGSTRLLTNSSGGVVGKCSYGAYGTPDCEGSEKTPLGYDGQYTNSDTGLVYLRAREYDPSTGQFVSSDPLKAITGEPYSYAGDNPLNAGDPSGLLFGIKLPSWEEVAEGIAGWGDKLTFGATKWAREELGDNNINECSAAYNAGGDAGLATAALIPGEDEFELGDEGITIGAKIAGQMEARGWTEESIQEAIDSGDQVQAVNKATGNPATRYVNPTTGQSVVVDDVTREVIHVGGPGFKYGPGSGDLP